MENNKHSPAFTRSPVYDKASNVIETYFGLTKREYFAAMAMQGILTAQSHDFPGRIAKQAIYQADTLLEELDRKDE